jgi:hypothetical protein
MTCPICREEHEPDRRLNYDGYGINSCGMYRNRIVTFSGTPRDVVAVLGPLFAASPAMLEELQRVADEVTDALSNMPYLFPSMGVEANLTPEMRSWRSKFRATRLRLTEIINKARPTERPKPED